jgi:hypothetical protein
VEDISMKGRKNPTVEQIARRLRRAPLSKNDPRIKNDAYHALKAQGFPHSYAIRAFRDQPPIVHQRTVCTDLGEYACNPDEMLFPADTTWTGIEVEMRPELSEDAIPELNPRDDEYTVWDQQVPRFGVRVFPSGHKSYIFNYRIRYQKKLHKHTIGRVADFTLEQARDIARNIRREARMGNDPVELIRQRAKPQG